MMLMLQLCKTRRRQLAGITIISLIGVCSIFWLNRVKFSINSQITAKRASASYTLIDIVNYKSRWDASENYRITSPLTQGKMRILSNDLTIVSQCSTSNLIYIRNLASRWKGPISIAVFSEQWNVLRVLRYITLLQRCSRNVLEKVTFHLVTYRGSGNLKEVDQFQEECDALNSIIPSSNNYNLSVAYPVNLLRNVARKQIRTKFFFLIDIDMSPSENLYDGFRKLATLKSSKIHRKAFVVPTFEIARGHPLPKNKEELKSLLKDGSVNVFYGDVCPKCQACVNHTNWLLTDNFKETVHVIYSIKWREPCEPFYIASVAAPLYDESFKQYGFNRVSQICELYLAGFDFVVLDNAFLIHDGLKSPYAFHALKDVEHISNKHLYHSFKRKLKLKYTATPRKCI